jgi:4-hydroxyphenylpyruvate dioxygenase
MQPPLNDSLVPSPSPDDVVAFDAIEIGVEDALATAASLRQWLDLADSPAPAADGGGVADSRSIVLRRDDVRIVVTGARGSARVARHVRQHGDGVTTIGLRVRRVDLAFARATAYGAEPLEPPATLDSGARVAIVGTPGDLVHTLVERGRADDERGVDAALPLADAAFAIDHVALAVDEHRLDEWIDFYRGAFGFHITHREITGTARSAMRSAVLESPARAVKVTLVAPAAGASVSQVEEFLGRHGGAGVQHIALRCDDIAGMIRAMRAAGIDCLPIPDSYYDTIQERLGESALPIETLRELRLLADRDEWGLLIQGFTKPITPRQTLFLEIVQRHGARGFGGRNIRALFEAVEREQASGALAATAPVR